MLGNEPKTCSALRGEINNADGIFPFFQEALIKEETDMLGYWEILIIFLIVLLIFGGKKIPEVAKGLGKGIREFKKAKDEITDSFHDAMDDDTAASGSKLSEGGGAEKKKSKSKDKKKRKDGKKDKKGSKKK